MFQIVEIVGRLQAIVAEKVDTHLGHVMYWWAELISELYLLSLFPNVSNNATFVIFLGLSSAVSLSYIFSASTSYYRLRSWVVRFLVCLDNTDPDDYDQYLGFRREKMIRAYTSSHARILAPIVFLLTFSLLFYSYNGPSFAIKEQIPDESTLILALLLGALVFLLEILVLFTTHTVFKCAYGEKSVHVEALGVLDQWQLMLGLSVLTAWACVFIPLTVP